MNEEERLALLPQIKEMRKKLRELESQFRRGNKVMYHHRCPYCKAEWEGNKEIIKECTYCKRQLECIIDAETKQMVLVRKL